MINNILGDLAVITLLDKPETVVPTEQDVATATESSRLLSKIDGKRDLRVHLETGEILVLPKAAARLLHHLLIEMSRGNAVTLIPLHAELTTQEAAEFLNVSRPYVIRLLETGKVKHRKVGTHRRIKFSDLQDFKKRQDDASDAALDELAKQAQELNMGY